MQPIKGPLPLSRLPKKPYCVGDAKCQASNHARHQSMELYPGNQENCRRAHIDIIGDGAGINSMSGSGWDDIEMGRWGPLRANLVSGKQNEDRQAISTGSTPGTTTMAPANHSFVTMLWGMAIAEKIRFAVRCSFWRYGEAIIYRLRPFSVKTNCSFVEISTRGFRSPVWPARVCRARSE